MTTEFARDEAELWDTLARYLAGESSPEEAARVRQWLAEDPARGELLAALERSLTAVVQPAPADIDVEAALQRVAAQIDEPDVRSIADAPARGRRRAVWPAYLARAAAVAVVALGAGLIWRTSRGETPAPLAVARTFDTSVGTVDSLLLDDGTRVVLAPGSRVVVAAGYGDSTHEVELTGEALFDVAPAAAGRFTVRAGAALIRDLGTTFTVRSDAGDEVRVVVTSGSVSLRAAAAPDTGALLRAGDRGSLGADGRVSVQRGSASTQDLAWTSGRLHFDNATLVHVAHELRRWYGVRLEFADASLATRHFTASFAGESVDSVLAEISLALDVAVERTGNTVVLRVRR